MARHWSALLLTLVRKGLDRTLVYRRRIAGHRISVFTDQGSSSGENRYPSKIGSSNSVYRSTLVWTFGLLLLLHVGVENGMGGWTTTFSQMTTGVKIETGALLTAGFWGLLTIGRLAGAALGIKLSRRPDTFAVFITLRHWWLFTGVGDW